MPDLLSRIEETQRVGGNLARLREIQMVLAGIDADLDAELQALRLACLDDLASTAIPLLEWRFDRQYAPWLRAQQEGA
jgi:hypothetical protein